MKENDVHGAESFLRNWWAIVHLKNWPSIKLVAHPATEPWIEPD